MPKCLHLAATLLLTGAMAHAQVSSPDKLIGQPPTPQHRQPPKPTDDLQWLWQYAKPAPIGSASDLRLDERFQSLLRRNFTQPQAMWGTNPEHRSALASVIPLFVSKYGAVTAEDNRYLTVDGCVPSFCPAAGLLWIDLGIVGAGAHPLMVFAGVNWNPENRTTDEAAAEYELWLFPNRNLDPNALPLALTESIAHWNIRLAAAHRLVPHIAHALLVEPNGSPYAIDPQLAGANNIAPQPDTITPHTDN
jgi:hypothetical protein